MHTSKSPGSAVLVNCEAESENCLCKLTLTEYFINFIDIPLDFILTFIHV